MGRRHRIIAALLTLAAFLFSQGAVAAHACAVFSAAQPAMEQPCEHEGSMKPNLCVSHCDFGNASVDSAKAPLPMPLLIQSALRVPSLVALAAPRQIRLEQRALPAPEPPPTRFVVLRI